MGGLRRPGLLVLLVLVAATAATSTASARSNGGPLDGMILRISDPTVVKGSSLGITACENQGVKGYLLSGPFANKQIAVLRPSPGGWTPTVMTQAARGSGGSLTPGYFDDGSLADVFGGWKMQLPDGSYATLSFGTDLPGVCAPVPTTTSADGLVSAITWNAQGCTGGLSDPSCGTDLGIRGTGCVAIDVSGHVLVATMQLGGCTPSAWPAVDFASVTDTRTTPQVKTSPAKKAKLPLCKKGTRSTKRHRCRRR